MADQLENWVVYERPADFPDSWVARLWIVNGGGVAPTDRVLQADSLDGIREEITRVRPGLYPFPRYAADDPCIKEVWI